MANIYDLTDSWNDAGAIFCAIKMDVTDTASQAGSMLIDLQADGVSKFGVRKDGSLTTPLRRTSVNGLTATGTNQTGALALTADVSRFTTCATDAGARLKSALAGESQIVVNKGAGRMRIYPATGENFNGGSADTSCYLPPGGVAEFYCEIDGTWESDHFWNGQNAEFTRGGGGCFVTGSGSNATGGFTKIRTPTDNAYLVVSDFIDYGVTVGAVTPGLAIVSTGKLSFGGTSGTVLAQLVPTTAPDLAIKVGNTPLTVARFLNVTSAVNNLLVSNAAAGNGITIATEGTSSNIDAIFDFKGTGIAQLKGGSWSANGSVATALSSVGPTGANTTVQEWLAVKNAAGTVRYIPCF